MERLHRVSARQRCFALRLLGPFALHSHGQAIATAGWQRRPLSLLRLLGASGGRCSRDTVIDLFWPDSSPQAGRTNLRQLLFLLRRDLGDDPAPVVVDQGWVVLNPPDSWDVDLLRFERAAAEAGDDLPRLEAAARLYAGEPLPEDRYDDWATPIRERVTGLYRTTVLRIVDLHQAGGTRDAAITWLHRLLEGDPTDEAVVQRLLRLLDLEGRRGDALRLYYRFEERLKAELDLEPGEATRALMETITAIRPATTPGVAAVPQPPPPPWPRSLPRSTTRFIGRQPQLRDIEAIVLGEDVPLLTLTGVGGSGKTRLALEVAHRLQPRYPEAIAFVPLASLRDPALVPAAIAAALGLKETSIESLRAAVGERHALLVLDNVEHLLLGALVVSDLLASCPHLTVVATSREPLHLHGERVYPVPPLDLAGGSGGAGRQPVVSEAVALFLDRAQAARVDFALTVDTLPVVTEICRRLDGLPLAIELAAARVRVLSPQAILRHLTSRLRLLTGGPRDHNERHQTLRGAIDWSYTLLSRDEQRLFAHLSVFVGGCTYETAEVVCGLDGDVDLLEGLTSLADKSLLWQVGDVEPRFSMLETIREYALEKLEESDECTAVREAHARCFLTLAQQAEPFLEREEGKRWLQRLGADRDNLLAALTWLLSVGRADDAGRLALVLWYLWRGWPTLAELPQCLDAVLAQPGLSPDLRTKLLLRVAYVATHQGDLQRHEEACREVMALAPVVRDIGAQFDALRRLGGIARQRGDETRARRVFDEALGLEAHLERDEDRAAALRLHGAIAAGDGDYAAAGHYFAQEVDFLRKTGLIGDLSGALINVGWTALVQDQLEAAAIAYGDAIAATPHRTHRVAQLGLAMVALRRGEHERALAEVWGLLLSFVHEGLLPMAAECVAAVAEIAAARGEVRLAASLVGAADALFPAMHARPRGNESERRQLHGARAVLGERAWTVAYERGRSLSLEDALQLVRSLHDGASALSAHS